MCEVVYNTPMNTVGIGDPVPFGPDTYGSGDLFGSVISPKKKTKKVPYMKKGANQTFTGFEQRPLIVMANKK